MCEIALLRDGPFDPPPAAAAAATTAAYPTPTHACTCPHACTHTNCGRWRFDRRQNKESVVGRHCWPVVMFVGSFVRPESLGQSESCAWWVSNVDGSAGTRL